MNVNTLCLYYENHWTLLDYEVMAMASFARCQWRECACARASCSSTRSTTSFNRIICGEIQSNVNFTKSFWQHNARRSSTHQHQPEDQIIIIHSFFSLFIFKYLQMPLSLIRYVVCAFDATARWIFHSNTLLLAIDLYHITLDRRRGWVAARLTILFANQWLNKFELCSTSRTTNTDGDGVGTIHLLHSCAQLHIHSKSICDF